MGSYQEDRSQTLRCIRNCRSELTDVDGNTMIGKRGDFPETKLAKDRPQRLGVLQDPDHCVRAGATDHGLGGPGVPGRAILDGTHPAAAGPGPARGVFLPPTPPSPRRLDSPPLPSLDP